MADRVLVIGSGAREHVLAWKLAKSPHVKKVFVAPGNAGTANNGKISNSAVSISNRGILAQFCKDHNIGLVVVGPEESLAAGIVDYLTLAGVRCFGPTAKAAQLEANKRFSKEFMDRHGIPTARWKMFTNPHEACNFITCADVSSMVVKVNGLTTRTSHICAGSKDEACKAVQDLTQDKTLGAAAETIIIEECLEGEEFSCLCFSDGITISPMPPVKEHKQLMEGDKGPSTEGMGAYCPAPQCSVSLLGTIHDTILQETVDGLREEDTPYTGVLHVKIMLTQDGPKVLQFKCSFGETVCQALLPLLKSDLYEVIQATIDGRLHSYTPAWLEKRVSVAAFMVSPGYPDCHSTGKEITGLPQAAELGLEVFHAGTAMKDDKVVTNGGRVLVVAAVRRDLKSALEEVMKGVATIKFPGAVYRKDIDYQAMALLHQSRGMKRSDTSENTCANIPLICAVKPLAADHSKTGCSARLALMAEFFDLKTTAYSDPILISKVNSVGIKLEAAQDCDKYDTIGLDLVAMCANDIVAQGAEPLFFMEHLTCGTLNAGAAKALLAGMIQACKTSQCEYLGTGIIGLPGMNTFQEFSLTGFMVGAVERGCALPQLERIAEGDLIIGVASSGFYNNEFCLFRKVLEKLSLEYSSAAPHPYGGQTWGELLLNPAKVYSASLLPVLRSAGVKACTHVTGGGLLENISRVLPESFGVVLDAHCWKIPEIFCWIQKHGDFSEEEMAQSFNCGIGAIMIIQKEMAEQVLKDVQKREEAWLIGSVVGRQTDSRQIEVYNLLRAMQAGNLHSQLIATDAEKTLLGQKKAKVAVLISGTGSHLEAVVASCKEPDSYAQVSLVISNRFGVEELKKAARSAIAARVMDHKLFGSRAEYDSTLNKVLEDFSIDLICLSGFMRTLSSPFVRKWKGKILNVHPSLLPSFKGIHAPKQALQAGVRVTGCTVHFILDETHNDAIILQEVVPVEVNDTEDTLSERVKAAEQRALPTALQLVARGAVRLGADGKISWKKEY
ncbi:trifunctional purine biosynthetic protein adenosine-3-like isoform X1 [Ambystoma mexicanum]|uniref:trifunctional purine biosynthetic protein adenosine-3-like isoform X1 n=1 Tax=Ambystoma mexicanum TaxID=8296 RepID=UPI0037E8928E